MRSRFVIVILLMSVLGAKAQNVTDSLLSVLDNTIEERDYYVGLREGSIDELRRSVGDRSLTVLQRYELNRRLFEQYRSLLFDSAYHYAVKNVKLTMEMGDRVRQVESRIDMSHILLSGGLFTEALSELKRVDSTFRASREPLPVVLHVKYYSCWEQTCLHMSRYSEGSAYEKRYSDAGRKYVDTLRSVLPASGGDKVALSRIYARDEDPWRGRRMLSELLQETSFGTHEYAIIAATLYRATSEDDPQRVDYLILSAISDIMCAVKENESLRDLAVVMYERGDITRAYNYSTLSMEDANFYNARLRKMEVAKTQPIIERAYTMLIEKQGHRLRVMNVLLAVIAVVLVVAVGVIWRQMRQLARARKTTLAANDQLRESNTIKEKYIGQFLNLCSTYVNKLERYQSMVHNRIVGGKLQELREMTASTEIIDREISSFYDTFDRAFIDLYPDFVEQLNSLLRPGERIVLKKGELLNNELRIFALIRLGITDSAGIATFLRYSANTVYTYRTKIRNKAIDKHSFEEHLCRSGL